MSGDELTDCGMHKIHSPLMTSMPPEPKPRRSLRSENTNKSFSLNNNFQSSEMEKKTSRQQNISNLSETKEDRSYENTQMTKSSSEEDKKTPSQHYSQNRSRAECSSSPEKNVCSQKKKSEKNTEENKQNTSYLQLYIFILVLVVGISFFKLSLNNKVQLQPIISNNPLLLTESVQNLKAAFYNQESDIWSDISSAVNEVISRTPKIPSIILLFAEETTTMNCLATKLAHMSSIILNADDYLIFNPKDFGNDAGEIITILNEHSPEEKKVVLIHDILNINAEAIKALHNLCDRINPLVAEAIYILTMQTNSSLSQQNKLNFVENQIYNRLSKNINQDILMALITRITDGVIMSVRPEPQLRYCS